MECGVALGDEREISLTTPLGPDKLLFRHMVATEQLGRPYEYELEMLSEDAKIKPEDILGQVVTVKLAKPDDKDRFFSGYVTRFALSGAAGNYYVYTAIVRPWFWLLTRTNDCRIYEGTVLDIIKNAFEDFDFVDYDDAACDKGKYVARDFCVQYRESYFDFVSRLMEEEGIYYWFKHADGKATMMLCDSSSGHETAPGCDDVPYYPPSDVEVRESEHVYAWTFSNEIQPGKYALDDFDFEKPGSDLGVNTSTSRSHKISALEIFDYPGLYVDPDSEGKHLVRTRLEELQSMYARARGIGDVRGLYVGGLVTLSNHPRDDQNKEYLVVSAVHDLASNEYETSDDGFETTFSVNFEALDSKEPFRAPRITPLPRIRGPQTATVVGPGGDEIWTDKYGRIKLQFHWDRRGKSDENSSYWVRVAQIWAGKTWGGIHIPRIGQEVIVEFLEGDPDQPIVTGAVYNADQMPPYGLPDNATQSGLKSRSSKGGGDANFNEIRMEDKAGSEELYIHAEKDHTNITENDRNEDVGHDRTLHVAHDKSEKIDNDKTITIGKNHDESIGANKTLSVGANHEETIGSNMSIDVGANLTENVAAAYAENVGAAMTVNVGAALAINVGAVMSTVVGADNSLGVGASNSKKVGGDDSESVDGGKTVTIAKDLEETIDGGHTESVTKAYALSAKTIEVVAEDEITIKTGDALISMKKDGSITFKGKDVTVQGSGKISVKADSDLILKGSKIAEN
jgi:type VI secretion system secreted protein VgrG